MPKSAVPVSSAKFAVRLLRDDLARGKVVEVAHTVRVVPSRVVRVWIVVQDAVEAEVVQVQKGERWAGVKECAARKVE